MESLEQEPINSPDNPRNRQVIAEGLNSGQLKTILGALVHNQRVNCIGTPSREEITQPERSDRPGVLTALGGFIPLGAERLFIDLSVALVQGGDPNQRFDIAVLEVPMSDDYLGIKSAVVAQIYPADPTAPSVPDSAIQAWLEASKF